MEPASDFPSEKFLPDNKNQEDLERDQRELLSQFERIESQLTKLKDPKIKDSNRAESRKLMNILVEIEQIWKRSRQMFFQLQNTPYEDIGIVQYRMLLFLEKRKAYRTKLENNVLQNNKNEKCVNSQNDEIIPQKGAGTKENKQSHITDYFKP